MSTQRIFPLTGPEQKSVREGAMSSFDTRAFKDAFLGALELLVSKQDKVPMLVYEKEDGILCFSITFIEHEGSRMINLPDSLVSSVRENHYNIEYVNKFFDRFLKDLKQGVATP